MINQHRVEWNSYPYEPLITESSFILMLLRIGLKCRALIGSKMSRLMSEMAVTKLRCDEPNLVGFNITVIFDENSFK